MFEYYHETVARFDYDPKDKKRANRDKILYMLNRTQQMFTYDGLPDSIPKRYLESILQTAGHATIFRERKTGTIVCDAGGYGGYPDGYRRPTKMIVANPYWGEYDLTIGTDCVLAYNDDAMIGLLPLFARYASAMTENELSMKIAMINSRLTGLFATPSDAVKKSMDLLMKRIEDGELAIGVTDQDWMNHIVGLPFGSSTRTTVLTDLIEMEQYLKAGWFNELGLNANYNMKRESLNSSESQMNNDALLPLVDDMLECRERFVDEMNKMFDLSVSVRLSSAWEDNIQEIELEHQAITEEGEPRETE